MKGRVEPDSRGSTPTQDNGHYPAVVTSNSSLPSLLTVNLKPQEPPPPGEGPPLIMPVPPGPPPLPRTYVPTNPGLPPPTPTPPPTPPNPHPSTFQRRPQLAVPWDRVRSQDR